MTAAVRFKLADGLEPVTHALSSLQQCAPEHRAFVILDDTVTGRFVQFYGSSTDGLNFDAPQLGKIGPKFYDPMVAAAYALEQLRTAHRLPEFAELSITFESTFDAALPTA